MNLLCVVILILISPFSFSAQEKEITVAVDAGFPPFTWTQSNGDIVGFDIDIINALCDDMKITCKIIPYNWLDLLDDLYLNKYDAVISALYITEERSRKVNFTSPYLELENTFLFNIQSKPKVGNWLEKTKVGVITNSPNEKYLQGVFKDTFIVVKYASMSEAYSDLLTNDINGVFSDALPLKVIAKYSDYFMLSRLFINNQTWFGTGYGIAINKSNLDLLSRFNSSLKKLKLTRKYGEIKNKFL